MIIADNDLRTFVPVDRDTQRTLIQLLDQARGCLAPRESRQLERLRKQLQALEAT